MENNSDKDTYSGLLMSCKVTTAQQALKSKFGQRIFGELSDNGKYKKKHLEMIMENILDESRWLSENRANDFLDFMDEQNIIFDEFIDKYIGRFPARIQRRITKWSMDMDREDHVLFKDGKYISLERIKEYVRSRIKPEWAPDYPPKKEAKSVWEKIQGFANKEWWNALQWKDLLELKKLSYNEYLNQNGETVSELEGVKFISMDSKQTPYQTFSINDFTALDEKEKLKRESEKIPIDQYSADLLEIKWENFVKNAKLQTFLKKNKLKIHQSIEQSNAFHFKLMQLIADKLSMWVTIDRDFVDNQENEDKMVFILSALFTLTRKNIVIPYHIKSDNILSTMIWVWNGISVYNDWNYPHISFFLEVE